MAIDNAGLNLMVDGIGQKTTLYLSAYAGATFKVGGLVTFDSASIGVADIVASVSLTIAETEITITSVKLVETNASTGEIMASATISAYFPDGGDLIIESYEITVTSS